MIYLDNAATTRIDSGVLDAMMPYLTEQYGNAGTLYNLGRCAQTAIADARKQVADFVGANPEQIIFTSGGTEANNMVFFSLWDFCKKLNLTHIVTSITEHESVLKPVREMMIKRGFDSTLLKVDRSGRVNQRDVADSIRKETAIVSVMYTNNETGTENPIEEIARICSKRDVFFHTDCVQAAGCCRIRANQLGCDFLTISSHKIHGPKGVGALYVKNPSVISPMILGGSMQEFGYRGGTENVAGIVGFGKACALMNSNLRDIDIHTSVLKQIFYSNLMGALKEHCIDSILHINGDSVTKHGKIINIRFDGVDGETLLLMLDSFGVCVSAGSACRSHESKPSRVLTAMGLAPNDAHNSIRVSFSKDNTEQEAARAAKIIASCVMEVLHI